MLRARLLILAPISAVLLSLLPSALGTDHPKPARQVLAQWSASSPIQAPVPMGTGRSALPATLSGSPNVAIVNPVLPPSPTSPATFKKGVAIPITGTAAGTGFQSFLVEWAPGLDATSGWQTIGVTLAGGGSSPITNGPLASWDTSSVTNVGYYTIRLTVTNSNSPFQALTMVYLEPDLLSANWPQFFNLSSRKERRWDLPAGHGSSCRTFCHWRTVLDSSSERHGTAHGPQEQWKFYATVGGRFQRGAKRRCHGG